ncbi:S1C family serine protease [Virgibacillus alimentarius]|uniref:S1-C subfamily serine protease n=1 Tax=Virgibacillus alimentarius TaxID=698769 RepID=A0ABS4S8T5_9BACI|nr:MULTISPECIES: serine protease [Virgibacillus]MBP2257375.1 S1-C subfamily serine protease [Virgibacillus alimentarius]HLR68603.1 serine protease [Virgibacillus sp.]
MGSNDEHKNDIIDEDLFEELDADEMEELLQVEREKALDREKKGKPPKSKRPFPKWAFWFIAIAMVFNIVALLPQTFSVPAIDFLTTSAKLSQQKMVQVYKKAVVVIETEDARGTGFSITDDGKILTNHHVVEGDASVTVAFPEKGLFTAEVVETYPNIDLAVLQIDRENGEKLPFLDLAENPSFHSNEIIKFIGNPLNFQGIANEGEIIDDVKLNNWTEEVVMIKAPVYRGNSGSPVINENEKVIGVVFGTLDHDEYGKVGMFVPIDYYYRYQKFNK